MTREKNRTKAMLLTIAMTLAGSTITSPAVAIGDSLEGPSGVGLEIPDLGGLHPSMGSTPIPGLTIEKNKVAQNESVTLVDPGEVPDPLGALWTVRLFEDTDIVFVTVVAMEIESFRPCFLYETLFEATPLWHTFPCEPVLHIADIADPKDIEPVFPPTGFRLCVYWTYVGLDIIPPEGEDDFGGGNFLLPEIVEDTKC